MLSAIICWQTTALDVTKTLQVHVSAGRHMHKCSQIHLVQVSASRQLHLTSKVPVKCSHLVMDNCLQIPEFPCSATICQQITEQRQQCNFAFWNVPEIMLFSSLFVCE